MSDTTNQKSIKQYHSDLINNIYSGCQNAIDEIAKKKKQDIDEINNELKSSEYTTQDLLRILIISLADINQHISMLSAKITANTEVITANMRTILQYLATTDKLNKDATNVGIATDILISKNLELIKNELNQIGSDISDINNIGINTY